MEKKFEYKRIITYSEREFHELGEAGWELVGFAQIQTSGAFGGGLETEYIFKREVKSLT